MSEARIECLSQTADISDLGLSLSRGDVVFVDGAKARNSTDLEIHRRTNSVLVQLVNRNIQTPPPVRQPTHPFVKVPPVLQHSTPPKDIVELRAAPVDLSGIYNRLDTIAQLLEKMIATIPMGIGNMFYPVVHPQESESIPSSRGTFIPEGIVSHAPKVDLGLDEVESGDSGLNDSVSALKAMKRRKKNGNKE